MIHDLIKKRRSIRHFSDKAVEFEKLMKILEAGIYAPSSGNIKDYRFTVVTEKGLMKEVANSAIEQYWIATAPLVIVVSTETDKVEAYYKKRGVDLYTQHNAAAAVQNILLSAEEEGLNTCWVGAFEEEKIKKALGMPDHVKPHAIIPLGYGDEPPRKRDEPMLEQYVYFNSYGNLVKNIHIVTREYNKIIADKTEETKGFIGKIKSEVHDLIKKSKKKQ